LVSIHSLSILEHLERVLVVDVTLLYSPCLIYLLLDIVLYFLILFLLKVSLIVLIVDLLLSAYCPV